MYILDRSFIDNSTLLLTKVNLYKYDIIILLLLQLRQTEKIWIFFTNSFRFFFNHLYACLSICLKKLNLVPSNLLVTETTVYTEGIYIKLQTVHSSDKMI